MKVFTISTDNNITVHASQASAGQTGLGTFTTEEGFAELIGPNSKRLVEIWNSLTVVTPLKKFTSREIAVRRIFAELQKLEAPAEPLDKAEPKGSKAERALKAAKEPKAARAAKTPKEPNTAVSRKKEVLLALVSREGGATLEELMTAAGWQKHSVRGFIATLNKTVSITSFKNEAGARSYKAA